MCYFGDCHDYFEADEQRDSEPVELYFERIIKETELAIYFLFDNEDILNPVKAWIPKSQITKLDLLNSEVFVPEWLAIEKGLI